MDAEGSYTGEATRIQSAALCVAERHGAVRSGRPLAVFTRVPEVWLLAPTYAVLSDLLLQNPMLLQVVQHDLRLLLRRWSVGQVDFCFSGHFVGRADAGEVLDLAAAGFGVELF
jgi:hypothetical protein